MNIRFYLFVSGVNQVELEREVSPRFPYFSQRDPTITGKPGPGPGLYENRKTGTPMRP